MSTRTGWSGVSVLRLVEVASWICTFSFSVTVCKTVRADMRQPKATTVLAQRMSQDSQHFCPAKLWVSLEVLKTLVVKLRESQMRFCFVSKHSYVHLFANFAFCLYANDPADKQCVTSVTIFVSIFTATNIGCQFEPFSLDN